MEIKDKYNFVFWTVYLIGFTILLPWNILITVEAFWNYKFRNVSADAIIQDSSEESADTDLQKLFGSYVAMAANIPNATFVVLHAIIGHKIPMNVRLFGSQIGMLVVLLLMTILSQFNSDDWQQTFLVLVILGIVLVNAFSAVFQGCMSSLLSPFPKEYLGHWVNGAGMGGLVPSIINVIFLAINPDPNLAGFGCFLFALVLTVLTLLCSYMMKKSPFYQHYYDQLAENAILKTESKSFAANIGSGLKETFDIYVNFGPSVWNYIFITFVNFAVTLCVFPAVCQLAQSFEYQGTHWDQTFYVAVCCFVIFNFADYAGKQLAVWIQLPGSSFKGQVLLLLATLSRVAMIPMFMFANVSVGNRTTEVALHSDAWYITLMVLFGLSNGYIGNIAMMFGPKSVKHTDHQVCLNCNTSLILTN